MDKKEEQHLIEEYKACEECGSVYLLSWLYKVSCWDRSGFMIERWLCQSCFEKLKQLRKEREIKFQILQRPKPNNLQFLRKDYER